MAVQHAGKRLLKLPRVRSMAIAPSIDVCDESELAGAKLVRIGASLASAAGGSVIAASNAVSVVRRSVRASEDAE